MVAQAGLLATFPTTQKPQRYKCPVHGGKKKSVAVWWNNGYRAFCHSHGCSQSDILAALGITNSQSIPWTPPPPRLRPATSVKPLPPVSHTQALDYLSGITTPAGAQITYQRHDGQRGTHKRWQTSSGSERRVPGIKGDGWQLRRFDPADPANAQAVALAEGEKDAATLAAAGLIAFTAPRGAQSLPMADFTELVALAKETGLPVLLCGDNDLVGRKAMRQVRGLLKMNHHLDATYLFGEEKGSIADLHTKDLKALIRLELLDRDETWQKPGRNRRQYEAYKCLRPKRNIKRLAGQNGYGTRCPAVILPPASRVANGKTSCTSKGAGAAIPLRWWLSPASVGLIQPLLKRWGWPRFTAGSWKTVYGKNPPFTRRVKTLLANGGFL